MASFSNSPNPDMTQDVPLYNTVLIRNYLEYVREFYPDLEIEPILKYAEITQIEIEDQGHWLSQRQIDRFNRYLTEKTGNPNISRDVGRYVGTYKASGALRQYLMGFVTPATAYRMLEKLAPTLSRGFTLKTKKLAGNKVEVEVTPKPEVDEKPFQCANRTGLFESLARVYTRDYAKVEHPSCYHKGAKSCRYIISWPRTPSLTWKRASHYSLLLGALTSLAFFFVMPIMHWIVLAQSCTFLFLALTLCYYYYKTKELSKSIEIQGDAAKDLLEEMNIRHANARLVQEMGQVTSAVQDIDGLVKTMANVMEQCLDFDRGMIMLANEEKSRLVYSAGYGSTNEREALLRGTEFRLDKPASRGLFVRAFREQKPFLVNDIAEIEKQFSKRSQELAAQMGVDSIICVPIVYERESLGILAVDNVQSKRVLTQSDMSLLAGVALQMAVGIINTKSYQQLQESEKKYRELVENANSIIMRMSIKGNITFFNEFAQRFFGYTEEEILGKYAEGTILPKGLTTRRGLAELIKSFQRDPERQLVSENEGILRDGERVWIAWTYRPIFDADGRLIEMLCIGNDITALRRSGQEKEQLQTQLQAAQKMEAIGTLAGGIAHDFNNILQTILGYTQILLMQNKPHDPEYEKLDIINRSARRASDLTKRLLIFSRKMEAKLRPVALNDEVVQVSKMLERTIPKMIDIELNMAPDLKVISADPVQVEQIMMNLAINARDAMPDGGKLTFKTRNIVLDEEYCRKHLGPSPGEYVLLSVSDTGHGFDKETQQHLFEPFFTTKKPGEGTGLGLSVVYGIVKNHKGYFMCQSEPDQGATFEVYFPVIEQELETLAPRKIDLSPRARSGSESILVVDDEENIRKLTQKTLSQVGYSVLTADDGESALELYRKECKFIDLIILDAIMPGMGGIQCLSELLKIDPQAKVVVVSGHSIDASQKKAMEAGARSFVAKPYELEQLLKEVREVLDGV